MPGNPQASVYIGNLDEKVDERVLYEIMVQAGPLVDLHMPRDKETKRHKGYAFAEFTSEKSAQYAVRLFSGLVSLHKKPLRFSISGQDKVVQSPSPIEVRGSCGTSDRVLIDSSIFNSQRPPLPACSPPVGYSTSPIGGLVNGSFSGYTRASAPISAFGVGQRLDFSPLAHAQTYNAHMVSLGQAGLKSHVHTLDQSFAYRAH